MLTDGTFLQWTRGLVEPPLTQRDNDLARDVRLCQLVLYTLVRLTHAQQVLEIGVADGSTTLALLKGVSETGGTVHSVDPAACPDAHRLVCEFGYQARWRFYNMKSEDFFGRLEPRRQFGLILVDGDHTPPAVALDIQLGWSHLESDGFMVLHDWHVASADEMNKATDPYTMGVARGLEQVIEQIKPAHVMPLWPHSREPDNGSEGMFLVLQKAGEAGNLDFFTRHGLI